MTNTKLESKLPAKPKAKAAPRSRSVTKATTTVTKKAAPKTRAVKKTTKPATTKKAERSVHLTETQKAEILTVMAKLIKLHKSDKDGLKSLTQVDRILDKYNQKYTDTSGKFDAIVKYGMEEDPSLVREHFYVFVNGKDKVTTDLYSLLSRIGKGELKFTEVRNEVKNIYDETLKAKRNQS